MTSEPEGGQEEPQELARTCPECSHQNAMKDRHCAACGASLREPRGEDPKPRAGAARRRARSATADDRVSKAQARAEFARTKQVAFRLRNVFIVGVLVSVAMLALLWKLGTLGNPDLTPTRLYLGYAVYGLSALVKLAGCFLVLRRPLVWSVVIAAEHTLVTVLGWWLGASDPIGLVLYGFFVIVFWAAVVSAGRLQRVMDANPELELRRGRVDRQRVREGGVATRARQLRTQSRWALLRLAGGFLAVVAVVILLVWWLNLPPGLAASEAPFRAAWQARDYDEFGRLGSPQLERRLEAPLVERGWDRAMPELGACAVEEKEGVGTTVFALADGGELRVAWLFDPVVERWRIRSIDFPDVEYAPFDGFAERFYAAWRSDGVDALVALYDPDMRAEKDDGIRRSYERRDWTRSRPPVRDVALRGSGSRRTLELETTEGDVSVRWRYRHPQWVVTGVRFP